MKFALTAIVLASSVTALAYTPSPNCLPAWDRREDSVSPNPIDHWPDRDLPGHSPCARGGGITIASCAPEVVDGNVSATDRTLATLVRTPKFATATQFRRQVSAIAAAKSPNLKVSKYFALIGIDATHASNVVEFVGARTVDSRWTSALQRNSGLSSAQADHVALKLQTALRGSLQ